jgi:hypothetical protein
VAGTDESAKPLRARADCSATNAEKNLLDQLRGLRHERLFEVGWREPRATSFVGVVQLPQRTLQILPKMYRHEDARERDATANLLYLFGYTRKLDVTDRWSAS